MSLSSFYVERSAFRKYFIANNYAIDFSSDVILRKQEFVTELPTSPASGKFYIKHKIVLFQKIEVGISGLSVQNYDQCLICKCNNKFIKEIK
jgi:hypothetical protein